MEVPRRMGPQRDGEADEQVAPGQGRCEWGPTPRRRGSQVGDPALINHPIGGMVEQLRGQRQAKAGLWG